MAKLDARAPEGDDDRMLDLAKHTGDWLRTLVTIPARWFLAFFIIGLIVLYAPPMRGMALETVRSVASPWVGLATVACGVFFVVQIVSAILHAAAKIGAAWLANRTPRTTPSLYLTLNPHVASAHWVQAVQRDGSILTQLMLDFFIHNYADRVMYLRASRLISPKVRSQDTVPGLLTVSEPLGGRAHSPTNPILSGADAEGRLVMFVRRPIGRPGKFLSVVFGVTDQTGHEYRLAVKLWPTPTDGPA